MARTAAIRAAAGPALLLLLASACAQVERRPDSDAGPASAANDAVPAVTPTADSLAETPSAGKEDSPRPDRTETTLRAPEPPEPAPTTSSAATTTTALVQEPAPTTTIVLVEPAPTDGRPDTGATPGDVTPPPPTETPDTAAPTETPDETPRPEFTYDTRPPSSRPDPPPVPIPSEFLPGEPYEFGPAEGTSLAVVGVDYDDVVNVREVPLGEIVVTLGIPNPRDGILVVSFVSSGNALIWSGSWDDVILATGRTRKLPDTVWYEVHVAGLIGWVNDAHLAPIGATHDVTAEIIDILDRTPVADTLTELAWTVGSAMASVEPPSRLVVVTEPILFEGLGEVTVDVLNVGDDSVLGFRLYMVAVAGGDRMSDDPGPFTLRRVERTVLCYSHRGVTADGLCM